MKLAAQSQAELVKVAAYGAIALIAVWAVKHAAQGAVGAAGAALDDAVDAVLAKAEDTWQAVAGPAQIIHQRQEQLMTRAPSSPAGIVGWLDQGIVSITDWVRNNIKPIF